MTMIEIMLLTFAYCIQINPDILKAMGLTISINMTKLNMISKKPDNYGNV